MIKYLNRHLWKWFDRLLGIRVIDDRMPPRKIGEL